MQAWISFVQCQLKGLELMAMSTGTVTAFCGLLEISAAHQCTRLYHPATHGCTMVFHSVPVRCAYL